MGRDDEYLLGTSEDEYIRLGFQHRVWARQAFALWERAGFGIGQKLLDLGCGPGYATVDLAQIVGPNGRICAVDNSERFITHAKAQASAAGLKNIEYRIDDIRDLDLAENSFDGAYARWLFCFLPEPQELIATVARALRPGGKLVVNDYYNYAAFYLSPKSDAFEHVVGKIQEGWRAGGGNLDVGRNLPTQMASCGLNVLNIKSVVRVARPGSALWRWPESFFEGFLPSLVENRILGGDKFEAFNADWQARSKDPSAYFCTPPMLDIIAEKT